MSRIFAVPIFAVLGLITAPLPAQPRFMLGGGPGMAWLSSKTRDEVQGWPKVGFNVLAQLEVPIGPELALVFGPSLESKGEKYELLAPDYYETWDDGKISLTYVQLPLLLKFSSQGPGIVVSGLVGPELGLLVGKRLDFNGSEIEGSEFSKWASPDFGVGWGAQVDFPRMQGAMASFFIRLGGYYGFVDGGSGFDNPFWKQGDYSSRNVNLKVTLGIRSGDLAAAMATDRRAPAPKPSTGSTEPIPTSPEPTAPVRNAPREVLEK
jgi:hypothetical protein